MKRLCAIALSAIVASNICDVVATEPTGFSDVLAYNETIDPTIAFMRFDLEESLGDQMVDFAREFLGRPYRSGGKGPSSFDCSGFTSYVYGNFGITLSPSSSTQYTQGYEIETADVRPGDLLFFRGRGNKRVGHVAMVVDIDADGVITFIHAATSSGIRYDHYPDGGYYSQRFLCAKRVL